MPITFKSWTHQLKGKSLRCCCDEWNKMYIFWVTSAMCPVQNIITMII